MASKSLNHQNQLRWYYVTFHLVFKKFLIQFPCGLPIRHNFSDVVCSVPGRKDFFALFHTSTPLKIQIYKNLLCHVQTGFLQDFSSVCWELWHFCYIADWMDCWKNRLSVIYCTLICNKTFSYSTWKAISQSSSK